MAEPIRPINLTVFSAGAAAPGHGGGPGGGWGSEGWPWLIH